jgi:sterol desaturase/sphingolipid hydroxylase (fatty acid hydroxylase superfamily)
MWIVLLQVLAGLVFGNLIEWIVHKYVLHGLGRDKSSFWSFHWHEHHSEVRKNDHVDRHYQRSLWGWHAQSKEALALVAGGVGLIPVAFVAPWTFATLVGWGVLYHRVHKWSHLDPDWARRWLPWHYDHHMALDQNQNWGVVVPWWDWVLGTRKVYLGTPREAEDRARRQAALAAKAARAAGAEPAPEPEPAAS